jgi:beta-galactosidase/beta-glucuronidase
MYLSPRRVLRPNWPKWWPGSGYRSDADINVTVVSKEGKRKSVEERRFYEGVHEDSATFEVPEPELWWCAGMGEPHLYDFQARV